MAGTIGTLSIDVLANIANLVSDLGRAQAENAKAAKDFHAQWETSIEGVKSSFETLSAVFGVGLSFEGIKTGVESLAEMASQSLKTAEEVSNLQRTLGVSSDTLRTVSYAATLVGGSLETATTALTRLTRSSAEANAGNAKLLGDFNAIGISSAQLAQLLKDPNQLLQVVTQHLAQFADGAEKTAVSMALMGRGAGAVIPLVDKLGEDWSELSDEAERFAGVTANDVAAMASVQESLNKTGAAVTGLKTQFTVALLPAIDGANTQLQTLATNQTVKDGIKGIGNIATFVANNFNQLATDLATGGLSAVIVRVFTGGTQAGMNMTNYLKIAFADLQASGEKLWAYFANWADEATVKVKQSFSGLVTVFSNLALFQGNNQVAAQLAVLADRFKNASAAGTGLAAALQSADDKRNAFVAGLKVTVGAAESTVTVMDTMTVHAGNLGKQLLTLPDAMKGADKANRDYIDSLASAQKFLDGLTATIGGPLDKVLAENNKAMDEIIVHYNDMIDKGHSYAEVEMFKAQAIAVTNQRTQEQIDKIVEQLDWMTKIDTEQTNELRLLTSVGVQHDVVTALIKAETQARKEYNERLRDTPNLTQGEIDAITKETTAFATQKAAIEQAIADQKTWMSTIQNGFDSVAKSVAGFATGTIKTWKDFGKSLVADAKSFIAQIIEEFLKMTVIRSIMNSLYPQYAVGGGGSIGGGGSLGGSLVSAGLSAFGGGAGGGGGGLMNMALGGGSSAIGQFLGGTTGGGLATSGAIAGGGTYSLVNTGGLSTVGAIPGGGEYILGNATSASSGAGFLGNGIGSYGGVTGIVGGVLAGLSEFKAAGGGIGGVAGGVAYGVGTSVLLGAASTALTAGLSAGLAAIPVVGWIALAAMAINMISGGKLFGTAGKPIGGSETETIGSTGANISAEMTFKGQKAFFGGSTYKEKNLPIDAATQKAADDFYNALVKGRDDFAKQFGVKMGDIVGGSFVTTFDKKGKATGTSDTVNGVTYKGETQDQFAERLQAGNYLAVLDKMGLGASKFVSAVQGDADKLFAAVQDFATTTQNINTNIGNGFKFLGLTGDQTIKSVMAFVQGLQQSGETLTQTYARLLQAQQQYNQFVAQFAPATVYVNAFQGQMAQLNTQLQANIDQANALAKASGMTSASQTDLTNIYKATVAQMAQLTAQLQANAQSLAFSLGLTKMGTLDQINAEISQLQGSTAGASSSVSGFGNAVQATAKKATDAMNLLLGNLSPLNDQQKLQEALKGLRAGSVTADQVLTIGRELYASSDAYTQLFNTVKGYAGKGSAGSGGGHGGGSGGGPSLSPADQAKLNDLMKQRDQLQAAQTMTQYQTLAQQIAEIASAKGQTFQQVIKDMGVDQLALQKGLGLKTDQDLQSYVASLQKQMDSAGQNTISIVNAINNVPIQIAQIIAGIVKAGGGSQGPFNVGQPSIGNKQMPASPPASTPPPPKSPGNPGGQGGLSMSDAQMASMGRAFVNALAATPAAARSLRALANVR